MYQRFGTLLLKTTARSTARNAYTVLSKSQRDDVSTFTQAQRGAWTGNGPAECGGP